MDNKIFGMIGKKSYEKAVDGFFLETRGILKPYDAVGALGGLLYLQKEGKLHEVTKETECPADQFGSKDYSGVISKHFITITGKLSHDAQRNIVDDVLSISKKDVSDAFEYALRKLTKDKESSEFIQPYEIGELANEIIKGQNLYVFNPFSGMMSYAVQMDNYKLMICEDESIKANEMAFLRIWLEDKHGIVPIPDTVKIWSPGVSDLIVTTPPFRVKIQMPDEKSSAELGETIALRRFEKSTTEKGQLFTVVPMSFLWSEEKEYANLRKVLVEKDFVDTIIMLPSNIFFSTSIATAIVYLSKKKESKGIVKIVDATDCFVKEKPTNIIDTETVLKRLTSDNDHLATPSIDEIAKHGYSLDFSRYTQGENVEVPEGYVQKKMDELVELLRCSRHFEDKKGHMVTVSSISDNVFDCYHSPEDFPITENLRNASKLTEPALVVSTIRIPKSNFVKASAEHPVFVSSDVKVFRVNEELIAPEYLTLQLSNLNLQHRGIVIPRISTETIMEANIVMPPSVDTQKSIVIERSNDDKLAKARELGLQDVIDKMKAEYINEVRMRKHDMRPYLREISSAEKMIRFYFSKRDSMEDFDSKVLCQLDNCRENIHKLSDLLEKLSSEEEFGEPELFDMNDYFFDSPSLKDMVNTPDRPGYKVVYNSDNGAFKEVGLPYNKEVYTHAERIINSDLTQESVYKECRRLYNGYRKLHYMIEMAHEDWDRLIGNILENSRKHGFTEFGKSYEFNINLSVESFNGKLMYRIDFADNGNPLPDGMDKERYGLLGEKAGKTAGTGQGGSIVKRIVEHYGGQYDIFSNGEGTTVRIWLPVPEKEGE